MQQLDTLRERLDPNGRWFRVGVVSATAIAPLIARWNDLQADKRAAELREQAEARLGDVRARLKSGANDMLRQAGPMAERLPFVQVKQPEKPKRGANTGLWLAGVAVGLVAAGVTAYVVARRRLAIPEDEEPMVELPLNGANEVWPSTTPSAQPAVTEHMPTSSVEAQDQTAGTANGLTDIDSTENVEAARFVGNIHTMIYHDADEEHLPAEENRIYFATEDEAHEAGFRRAHSEGTFGDEAHVGSAEAPNA